MTKIKTINHNIVPFIKQLSKTMTLNAEDDEKVSLTVNDKKVGHIEGDGKDFITVFGDAKVKSIVTEIEQKIVTDKDIEGIELFKNCISTKHEAKTIKKLCKDFNTIETKGDFDKYIMSEVACLYFNSTTDIPSEFLQSFGIDQNKGKELPIERIKGENITTIKVGDFVIGKYYVSRNIIVINFAFDNIFKYNVLETVLKSLPKIKLQNISKMKHAILSEKLLSGTKERLKSLENDKERFENDITNYKNKLSRLISDKNKKITEIDFIKNTSTVTEEFVANEIEKLGKFSFIKDIKIENGDFSVTYVPTFLSINDFDRGQGSVGKRDIFLGEITIKLGESFIIENTHPIISRGNDGVNYPHTHANQEKRPCFGSGDGYAKIMELKDTLKLSDLFWYLWQWVKTHRDDGSYIKSHDLYDDRLMQGLPVWDGNTRIVANDSERKKEQIQLTKSKIQDKVEIEKPKL